MVDFDTDVLVDLSGSVLSDPFGQAVDHEVIGGNFTVIAAPLSTPATPENISASGGQKQCKPFLGIVVWQAAGYHVWRDGGIVSSVTATSYTETNLDDDTVYCYKVSAYNEVGESDQSGDACATTFPEYTGPPLVSVGSASINAGDVFDIDISLANPGDPVAGIQIRILDAPDHLDVNDVVGTDRLEGFTLSWNSQGDGSVLFVAFSLTGDVVVPGTGPIAVINYQSVTPYEASVSLNVLESILSDSNGSPIEHDATGGSVDISGEEPPPEAPDTPTGLTATEGDSQVSVSWNASFGASEYLLYREDQGNDGGDDGGDDGGGDGDPYIDCTDGTGDYADCVGTCFTADYLAWFSRWFTVMMVLGD